MLHIHSSTIRRKNIGSWKTAVPQSRNFLHPQSKKQVGTKLLHYLWVHSQIPPLRPRCMPPFQNYNLLCYKDGEGE